MFHPIIRGWFAETYGEPTGVQAEAWPLIEKGENVLAIAPTGSGKTLTAFLSALSRFCSDSPQKYDAQKLSVLYVSPLKALNEDIKRNLLLPLAAIKTRFEKEGLNFPPVHVETRSGDTPQSARRRFFIHPPSILALTPESLAIILLNPKGRQIMSHVKCVIIDEIHALLGNKRGAYLSCQIERLTHIAGDFQRISLSATIRNPEAAADFTGGIGRKVKIACVPAEKKIEFNIEYPEITDNGQQATRYAPLIDYILRRIWEGATLLVFAESRRRAERLCFFLNNEAAVLFARHGSPPGRGEISAVAYPHHGSLSKEMRKSVEKGLAEGRLPCVVATSSLELGIDIGDIDEVVLAGSPSSVSQTIQRIGRCGHGVGQVSKGRLFAFHNIDLLTAAALKSAVDDKDIEEIHSINNPQDILAQLVLALCAEKDRNIEELYSLIKTFYIFKNLNYDSYIRVVRMLAGLGEKSRLRDIKPRIWLDKIEEKIGVLDGAVTLLYTSSGVIANRGLYSLRLADGTKIGELDEEFVWERSLGDRFDFGARGWKITNISSEAVEVVPLDKKSDFIPFWKADLPFRSNNLSERILSILDEYNKTERVKIGLQEQTADALKNFLDLQRASQRGLPLPDNKNIIIEIITGTELNRDFCSVVLHSFRGGKINYPLSLALSAEIEEIVKLRVASFSADNNILFLIPRLGAEESAASIQDIIIRALSALARTDTGAITRAERFFRNRLESSGVFGASFREAAERSMLLPKAPFGKRTPLWIMRQRSKRLFDSVSGEDGFPVTAEAWRNCLVDIFDMEGFKDLVLAISGASITVSFFQSVIPSPFSRDVIREETNSFMYEYDERKDLAKNGSAALSDKVIEEAVKNSSLRPKLKQETVNSFTEKLRREKTGYAPHDALSLGEWVKERIAIPHDEWQILTEAAGEIPDTAGRIKTITRKNASLSSIVHLEWEEVWQNEPLSILGQWLRYEGPVSIKRICDVFGVTETETKDAINALLEVEEIADDVEIMTDSQENQLSSLICDRENLELLLRISRKKDRPVITERKPEYLVPFLALRQGLCAESGVKEAFEKTLLGWTAPAKLWETEILTARNNKCDPEKLDRIIREGQLVWYGAGKEKTGFCRGEDLDLVLELKKIEDSAGMSHLISSSFFNRPRDFWEIKNELNTDSRSCAKALWDEAWQGNLTSDSFEPVRRGIELGFIPKEIEKHQSAETKSQFGRQRRIPGALKNLWKSGAPVHGNWFSLLPDEDQNQSDPIEEEAINRDRVRLLLNRWGILCRPFFEHEASVFSWLKLMPAMRRMELAGELVTGRFFSGINSLQFASPSIAAQLEQTQSVNGFYWMNASDPASPAGLDIEGLPYKLCARSAGNRLYFKRASLAAISEKSGKTMQINLKADDPDIHELIALFKIPRTRNVRPENKITIEKINGEEAAKCVYASCFKESGFISDRGKLIFWQ